MDSVVKCIQMGAEDYLTKPVDQVLLQARIDASLEKKRLRDEQRNLLRKMEAELDFARKIQRSILPGELPRRTGCDFGALMIPARAVGGDFYDSSNWTKTGWGSRWVMSRIKACRPRCLWHDVQPDQYRGPTGTFAPRSAVYCQPLFVEYE